MYYQFQMDRRCLSKVQVLLENKFWVVYMILKIMVSCCKLIFSGDTTVIVGVYGPVEVKLQKMMYDKASVEATYTAAKGPQSKFKTKVFESS